MIRPQILKSLSFDVTPIFVIKLQTNKNIFVKQKCKGALTLFFCFQIFKNRSDMKFLLQLVLLLHIIGDISNPLKFPWPPNENKIGP